MNIANGMKHFKKSSHSIYIYNDKSTNQKIRLKFTWDRKFNENTYKSIRLFYAVRTTSSILQQMRNLLTRKKKKKTSLSRIFALALLKSLQASLVMTNKINFQKSGRKKNKLAYIKMMRNVHWTINKPTFIRINLFRSRIKH